MALDTHDPYWDSVLEFLQKEKAIPTRVIAPREFNDLLPGIVPYELKESRDWGEIEWVVVHKGCMEELGRKWLDLLVDSHTPVFANEVFVLFVKSSGGYKAVKSIHVEAFLDKLRSLALRAFLHPDINPSARTTVYLGDFRALTRTVYGHKMYVDTRDLSLSPHLLLDGTWEPWITKVFIDVIQSGMNVVDIGANIGYYSLLAARAIGPKGALWSFEANPHMADILFANLEINGYLDRAHVINKAVFREATTLEFHVYDKHLGSSSLFHAEGTAAEFRDKTKTITVDSICLDDFFAAGTKIDLIKIDTEGAEPYIFEGARRIIHENPHIKIVMEFAPSILAGSHGPARTFYNNLSAQGFEIYRIEEDSTLKRASYEYLEAVGHSDIVLQRGS